MSYANNKKLYVATYKEIIIGFIVFCIILVVLYPKDTLTKQVLAESSNYDLSVIYLENMLKSDPSNEQLMLSLAQQAIKANKKYLAYKLLKILKKSKDVNIKKSTYLLSYQIAKEDYFYLKKEKKRDLLQQKYKELQTLFKTIIAKRFYTKESVAKLYKESSFLHDTKNGYFLLQKLLQKDPNNIKLLSDAYYLSSKLHKYDESISYLQHLTLLDKPHQNRWLDAQYYLLINYFPYKEAQQFLILHAKNSPIWEKRLIDFYIAHKQYKKAAQLYMNDFHHTTDPKEQLHLWFKAIQTLQAGVLLKDAVQLGSRYENYFFQEKKARVMLLKLYISANDLHKANRLSQKILKIKR